MADMTKFMADRAPGMMDHLRRYLESNGQDGFYRDMSGNPEGAGDPKTLTLILKTIGRKSGRPHLAPLLFNYWGADVILIASKGGHDQSPAWYLNMLAADQVSVQIRDKRYACKWRIADGEERQKLWDFMSDYYPPFHAYQARTERRIPVIVLTPVQETQEAFKLEDGAGLDQLVARAGRSPE